MVEDVHDVGLDARQKTLTEGRQTVATQSLKKPCKTQSKNISRLGVL